MLESVAIVGGVTISYWISFACRNMDGEISWRLPFALQLPSVMLLRGIIQYFPYSPRSLVMKDRYEECLASLCRLRNLPASDTRVQAEHRGILAEVKFQAAMRERRHPGLQGLRPEIAQWSDLFSVKRWRRTAAGVGVAFFRQLQGVNVSSSLFACDDHLMTDDFNPRDRLSSTTLRPYSETCPWSSLTCSMCCRSSVSSSPSSSSTESAADLLPLEADSATWLAT